jgi:hypothetical protein
MGGEIAVDVEFREAKRVIHYSIALFTGYRMTLNLGGAHNDFSLKSKKLFHETNLNVTNKPD